FSYYLNKHAESSLRMMVGTVRPEESELVTGEHVRSALDVMRRQFVHGVVDSGAGFNEACLAAMEAADHVIVVTTPEPSAVESTLQTQRVLRDLLGCPPER